MRKRVVQTIEQIIADPSAAEDGLLANQLLEEFQDGAPLEYLQRLLLNPDAEVVSVGAWIASELGFTGKPLLDVVVDLLDYPDKRVRFWIIDCVLLWAEPTYAAALSKVIRLIDDPEKAVRWKAMVFISRATKEQLDSALGWLETEIPESSIVTGLRWLLGNMGCDLRAIEVMLQNPDLRLRKFAAIAAVRLAVKNHQPLILSASTDDTEVTEFLADSLVHSGNS